MKKIITVLLRIGKLIVIISAIGGVIAGIVDVIDREKKTDSHEYAGVYEKYLKRPFDFMCAMIALLVLWPVFLVIAILVRVNLGSPVLFSQERPGKDEKIFKMYKFRSMTDKRDENGELLPDEERLTRFGKLLRATSLDELPELLMILKGDMSLIGPRPLLVKYLPYYSENQHHRHDVRPGLSGYAQVNGRNTVNWDERFEMDLKYVEHITFWGDVKIIVDTILKAFIKQEGISSETSVTMEDFRDYTNNKKLKDID